MELAAIAIFIFFCVVGTESSKEAKRIQECKDKGGVMVVIQEKPQKSECKLPEPAPAPKK